MRRTVFKAKSCLGRQHACCIAEIKDSLEKHQVRLEKLERRGKKIGDRQFRQSQYYLKATGTKKKLTGQLSRQNFKGKTKNKNKDIHALEMPIRKQPEQLLRKSLKRQYPLKKQEDKAIITLIQGLQAKIQKGQIELNDKIQKGQIELNDKIQKSNEKVSNLIQNTKVELNDQIQKNNQKLSNMIEKSKAELTDKIGSSRIEINQKFQQLKIKIEERQNQSDNRIFRLENGLNERIEEIQNSQSKLNQKIEILYQGQNKKIQELYELINQKEELSKYVNLQDQEYLKEKSKYIQMLRQCLYLQEEIQIKQINLKYDEKRRIKRHFYHL